MSTNVTCKKETNDIPPIDKNGKPTTYLSYMVLNKLFSEPKRPFTLKDLTKLLAAKYSDIDLICNQLTQMDIILEESSDSVCYRYNLNSANADLQAKFEKFLVEVELESLPVHLILPYSPSFCLPPYLPAARPE